jgi:hypothetical protein
LTSLFFFSSIPIFRRFVQTDINEDNSVIESDEEADEPSEDWYGTEEE